MAKLLSMPVSASLYPEPPYLYPKAELAVIFYSVDRDAVEHIVPAPLKLARTPMCVAFVAWYPETTIGPYHEAATFIEAKLKTDEGKVSAFYCNAMFVDCDIALAAGREIWGFPKKIAEMSVKREGNTVVGLMEMRAKETHHILGIGRYSGEFFITQTRHVLAPGDIYKTSFVGRRELNEVDDNEPGDDQVVVEQPELGSNEPGDEEAPEAL